jgi:hypothetical protein
MRQQMHLHSEIARTAAATTRRIAGYAFANLLQVGVLRNFMRR